MKRFILFIYFFNLIANINCQQYRYVPSERYYHTASLVGTKIYFLGGSIPPAAGSSYVNLTNEFFYLDITNSFNKTNGLPFVNLTDQALQIQPHFAAATTVFGEQRDSIFLFGGFTGEFNNLDKSTFSFNVTQSGWKSVTVSQDNNYVPLRRIFMDAVADNNDKIYIFGGTLIDANVTEGIITNELIIFDVISKIWTNYTNGPLGRTSHTSTFLPDTKEIIYIGGTGDLNYTFFMDMTNLDVYNTISGVWSKRTTKNPPAQRIGHSAVLTKDYRIIICGGVVYGDNASTPMPVKGYYEVLDTKTFEWYHGEEDVSVRAPNYGHTASLYNDYMIIAFGYVLSSFEMSNDVLIYKIDDYANYTEVDRFINGNTNVNPSPTEALPPTSSNNSRENGLSNTNVIIIAVVSSVLGTFILGIAGFCIFRKYKENHKILILETA